MTRRQKGPDTDTSGTGDGHKSGPGRIRKPNRLKQDPCSSFVRLQVLVNFADTHGPQENLANPKHETPF